MSDPAFEGILGLSSARPQIQVRSFRRVGDLHMYYHAGLSHEITGH